jgi:hypothetical protein
MLPMPIANHILKFFIQFSSYFYKEKKITKLRAREGNFFPNIILKKSTTIMPDDGKFIQQNYHKHYFLHEPKACIDTYINVKNR